MEYMESRMQDHIEHGISENNRLTEENERLRDLIGRAYGFLWCVNNEPGTPVPIYTPEHAALEARKILRDTMTSEQRGKYINVAVEIVRSNFDT